MKKSTVKKATKTGRVSGKKLNKANTPKEAKLPKFWILWGPASHKPPTKRFHSRKHAEDVAEIMVNKHGGEFYVMESSTLHKKATPPVLKLNVTGEPRPTLPPSNLELEVRASLISGYKTYEEWRAEGMAVKHGERHRMRRYPDGRLARNLDPCAFSPGDASIAVFHSSQVEPAGFTNMTDWRGR
jgi:hypothetical protein